MNTDKLFYPTPEEIYTTACIHNDEILVQSQAWWGYLPDEISLMKKEMNKIAETAPDEVAAAAVRRLQRQISGAFGGY